jgi:hypothetical protein
MDVYGLFKVSVKQLKSLKNTILKNTTTIKNTTTTRDTG